MRPDDFGEQLLITGHKAARLTPEIDEAFQIVNDCRNQQIDYGFPGDVVDEWLIWKPIDQRKHVREQDRLAENESSDGNRNGRRWRDAGSFQHQNMNERDDMERHEKINRRRK